jgi:hypothetical protein
MKSQLTAIWILILSGVSWLTLPYSAEGTGCARLGTSSFNGEGGVSIDVANFPNSISTEVGNAAGTWNDSSCEDTYGAGFDFPWRSTISGQYSATLSITYAALTAPTKACSIGGVAAYCAIRVDYHCLSILRD